MPSLHYIADKIKDYVSCKEIISKKKTITIPVLDKNVRIPIQTKSGLQSYTGSIFSIPQDIVKQDNHRLLLVTKRSVRPCSEFPIIQCLCMRHGEISVLANCYLKITGNSTFSTPNIDLLRFLILKKCKIKILPKIENTNIKYLDLSYNELKGTIYIIGRLDYVNVSHNKLSRVYANCANLNVSHNRIRKFIGLRPPNYSQEGRVTSHDAYTKAASGTNKLTIIHYISNRKRPLNSNTLATRRIASIEDLLDKTTLDHNIDENKSLDKTTLDRIIDRKTTKPEIHKRLCSTQNSAVQPKLSGAMLIPKYSSLNISHNPLKTLQVDCNVLDISHTNIKVIQGPYKIVHANFLRNVSFGELPNLKYISLINCGMHYINLPSAKHVNASHNFLESVNLSNAVSLIAKHNYIYRIEAPNLEYLDLAGNFSSSVILPEGNKIQKCYYSNNLRAPYNLNAATLLISEYTRPVMSSKKYFKYRVRHPIDACYILYVISTTRIDSLLSKIVHEVSGENMIDYVENLQDRVIRELLILNRHHRVIICAIMQDTVIVRSSMRAIFCNYAHCKDLHDNTTYLFDNIGRWHIIPLAREPKYMPRIFNFNTVKNDLPSLIEFLGIHTFPDAVISNTLELYTRKPLNLVEICNIKPSDSLSDCSNTIKTYYHVLNWQIYDPFSISSIGMPRVNTEFLEYPIFIFASFKPKTKKFVFQTDCDNIRNIFGLYNAIFMVSEIEIHDDYGIFLFNDKYDPFVWSLRMHDLLTKHNYTSSFGISHDTFYTKVVNKNVRFYGPALNKAARISKLGLGVFCCENVIFEDPFLEFVEVGKVKLKGFDNLVEIFTPCLEFLE